MITELQLKQYRGFSQYKLASLARVNLLVGKNNSGKTSILEAVRLLGAGGDPRVLTVIARQRGEVLYDIEDRDPRRSYVDARRAQYAEISHFFNGHVFEPGTAFALSADDDFGTVIVEVVALADLGDKQPMLFEDVALRSDLGIRISDGGGTSTRSRSAVILPTEEGALSYDQASRFSRVTKWKADEAIVNFVSQDSLDRGSMSEIWDRIVTEGREQDVVKAMRILEPELESIVFLSGDRILRSETRGGILVGFQGVKGRLPLGSFGEGMRRMLALAISLAKSQGGILLVDEIDTGLHYSIMGDMWLLVVEAAIRYDIQVFVTTHSFDCIRGLAWLCRHHTKLQGEVSLQKIERELDQAVALDAEQIMIAVEQNLEVR